MTVTRYLTLVRYDIVGTQQFVTLAQGKYSAPVIELCSYLFRKGTLRSTSQGASRMHPGAGDHSHALLIVE
ncbi:MAG: hypothetical protein AAGF11_15575 [Myxococcota bacterium]